MAPTGKSSFEFDVYGLPAEYKINEVKPPPGKWSIKKPRTWGWKTYTTIAFVVAAAVVGGAVGGVVSHRNAEANAYPNYYPLTYTLQDTYAGTGFFNNFDYFTGYDPAQGLVHYVPAETADSTTWNLTYAGSNAAVVRVDASSGKYDTATGRYSVRLTSKKQYNSGLFLFDISHMPYGCSVWPAIWLSDPSNWPYNGEIDVIESVNQATSGNQATLHTTSGCTMASSVRKMTGTSLQYSCLNSTNSNAGCGVSGSTNSAGEAFNNIGGGVFAMEWRTEGIRVWFFERSSIPSNIATSTSNTTAPDPSVWPEQMADFPNTNCNIGNHFRNASIIMNIDLCGSWAGATGVYSTQDQCPGLCTDFVANNSAAYDVAYWQINSFKVYSA